MLKQEDLIVNSKSLKPQNEYVCWIDSMGTGNTMSVSFERAANFMLRFHSCVIDAINGLKGVHAYPVMDGVYISSSNIETMSKVLKTIYTFLSQIFLEEKFLNHKFIIRGALAYGQIAHGEAISQEICKIVASDEDYKGTIMMGMPMIQAYKSEKYAPPFGIYIHESARKVEDLQGRYFLWCHKKEERNALKESINTYFNWCKHFLFHLDLDLAKVNSYMALNEEHFSKMNCSVDEFKTFSEKELKN